MRTLFGSSVLTRVSLVSHPSDGSVQSVSASLRLPVLTLSSLQLLLQLLRGSEDGEHGRMTSRWWLWGLARWTVGGCEQRAAVVWFTCGEALFVLRDVSRFGPTTRRSVEKAHLHEY